MADYNTFIEKNFHSATMELIGLCDRVIADYRGQGLTLTLRQLYYQLVARGHIPNRQKEYKRLGGIVADARLAGLLPWDAIEDRTRALRGNQHWTSPASIVRAAVNSYRIDKWETQPTRVEVWIEKDALVGVIGRVCSTLDVDYFSTRGYASLSEMYDAGYWRLRRYAQDGQIPFIIHLADHDPSGVDMTRDVAERLAMFSGLEINVLRAGLNMDQVDLYQPPPNPAKLTDSRSKGYILEYGRQSWELDALDPTTLRDLITDQVVELRDQELWDAAVKREEEERAALKATAESLAWDGEEEE